MLNHPWRFPKVVRYEFNMIARMLHYLPHTRPKLHTTLGELHSTEQLDDRLSRSKNEISLVNDAL